MNILCKIGLHKYTYKLLKISNYIFVAPIDGTYRFTFGCFGNQISHMEQLKAGESLSIKYTHRLIKGCVKCNKGKYVADLIETILGVDYE